MERASKSGVPRPVAASQPLIALKPWLPPLLLVPRVTSWKPLGFSLVDERVQEAHRRLARGETDAVELGEDAGGDGAGRRGAGDASEAAQGDDAVRVLLAAERGDVGVATARVVPLLFPMDEGGRSASGEDR